ncbi:MAG: dockerin type I domain-containing protein [Hespellia sp.]|nr:dockerin type I domain-containing protein [Hespellia sp.]
MKKRVKQVMALVLVVSMMFGQTAFAAEYTDEGDVLTAQTTEQEISGVGTDGDSDTTTVPEETLEEPEEVEVMDEQEEQEPEVNQEITEETQAEAEVATQEVQSAESSQNAQQFNIKAYTSYEQRFEIPVMGAPEKYSLTAIEGIENCDVTITGSRTYYDGNSNTVTVRVQGKQVGNAVYQLSAGDTLNAVNIGIVVVDEQLDDIVSFPDNQLCGTIYRQKIDGNKDGLIQKDEIEVYDQDLDLFGVKDFSGLEYATNLKRMTVRDGVCEAKNIEIIKNIQTLTYLGIFQSTTPEGVDVIAQMTQLTSLYIEKCEGIDFQVLSTLSNLESLSYGGSLSEGEEEKLVTLVRELPKLGSINVPSLSKKAKLEIIVLETMSIKKAERRIPFYKGLNPFNNNEAITVTVSDDTVAETYQLSSNSVQIIGKQVGKTNVTIEYEGEKISFPLEVTGVNENIVTEESKGNNHFAGNLMTDSTVTVLRENKELWEVYPEAKKVASGVEQYVAAYVYELGAYNSYMNISEREATRLMLKENKELWVDSIKVAERVSKFDSHYALTEDGKLQDIYNTENDSVEDVKDWGRITDSNKYSGANRDYYTDTVILKEDGTLWSREDVAKGEVTNSFEQMASDVKQLVKLKDGMTCADVVVGYVKHTGEFIGNDGTVINRFIDTTQAGIWSEEGFFLWIRGGLVKISNFKVDNYFYKYITISGEVKRYGGISDDQGDIWIMTEDYDYSSGFNIIYGEPKLIGDNYKKMFNGSTEDPQAFYVGTDNKIYDIEGKEVMSAISYANVGYYTDDNHMLYHYGIAILSEVNYIKSDSQKTYAIRTDGTVWDVTDIPTQVTNFSIKGEELPEDQITEIIKDITDAKTEDTINIDMGSATVIPREALEAATGKDIELQLKMDGYSWTISGKDINADALHDVNLEVVTDTNAIPQDTIVSVAGENPTKEISLTYEGTFGFKGYLMVAVGNEYAGKTGTLYYYEGNNKLTKTTSGVVDAEGNLTLAYEHASNYVIVFSDNLKKGDVNGDNNVNLKDLMIILKHVSGKESMDESKQKIADVNADGKVDLKDLMLILKFVSGKITEL